jgi:hypothetical protein
MDSPKNTRRLLTEWQTEHSLCKLKDERLLLSARLTAQQ